MESGFFQQFAATTIQRYWRGYRERKRYLLLKRKLQALHTDWHQTKAVHDRLDFAIRAIQTAWRAFRNKRIYRYYRDLIQFRERGDPRDLLRCINPREAQLVDAASGIHVRFRLGGTIFPPLVFYKIFTHRPVADICAFGPRDYAAEVRMTAAEVNNRPRAAPDAVQRRPKNVHTYKEESFELEASLREYLKPDGSVGLRSTQGWYERHENNGWRPISERVLVDEDPVTAMTRLKRQPLFHYNPGVRREEKVRKAKQRKREWLLKVYRDGMLGAAGAAGGAPLLDPQHPDFEAHLADELADTADDLLEWAQHLDFDAYVGDWTSLACTLGSEAYVPELDESGRVDLPGPPKNVARAMALAGAPLAPFKGGATGNCGVMSTVPTS